MGQVAQLLDTVMTAHQRWMPQGPMAEHIRQLSARAALAMRPYLPKRLRRDLPVVPVVRLTGVIGFSTPLRPGLSIAGIARTLERAFGVRNAAPAARPINPPAATAWPPPH